MRCPTLAELPPPPAGRVGWPWTEETPLLAESGTKNNVWPKVSIVTSTYNFAGTLEETIRSVLLQSYPDLEYIVIDGGSTDGSVAIIEKYARWLTYWVSEADRGPAHATSKGLERASGILFGNMCADDLFLPAGIHSLVKLQLTQPDSVAWVGACPEIDPLTGDVINKGVPFIRDARAFGDWGKSVWFVSVACLFRADAYRRVGGFDLRFVNGNDVDLWMRIAKTGTFSLTDKLVARSRLNPRSASHRDKELEILSWMTSSYLNGYPEVSRRLLLHYAGEGAARARQSMTLREIYQFLSFGGLLNAMCTLLETIVCRFFRGLKGRLSNFFQRRSL